MTEVPDIERCPGLPDRALGVVINISPQSSIFSNPWQQRGSGLKMSRSAVDEE
jgi:hypothetical protein